ncbi:MAG: MFS transporter [bacterium]|nr:hypothetical protein [Deltaproteobacteria bacterium]MCP4906043.1 MFS transporter [bacterium]
MTTAALPSPSFKNRSRQVLMAGFTGSFFSVGFSMYLFGVFQNAMLQSFEGSVAMFSLAPTVMSIISGVLSPFVGRALATRARPGVSIRTAMVVGALGIGTGLLGISWVQSAIGAALIFALLIAPGTVMLGPLVTQTMITNWFEATRGQKLGIVVAGTTVAGGLVPVFAAQLIELFGWRDALAILGVIMLAVPLPIAALLARSTPEEVGESPDGAAAPKTDAPTAPSESPLSTADLLRLPAFWLCGILFALQFTAGSVSVLYTVPYAQQLGLGLVASASILSLRSLFGALGKVMLGSLSDRVGVKRMIYCCFAVEIALTTLMVQTRDPIWFTVFGVGIGFVGAAMLPLKGAFVGELFGRANFGSALGLMQTVALPFSPLLIPLAGYVKDLTDDYAVVFAGAIPLYAVGALLLSFIKSPDARA